MEKEPTPQRETIELPENREPLQQKLAEYESRLDEFLAPEMQFDTIYKIAVLKPLVTDGIVRRAQVKEALRKEYGPVDERKFRNAWSVMADYVQTGGKKLSGGTGLPRREEDPELGRMQQ